MSKLIHLPIREVFRLADLVKVRPKQVASMDLSDSDCLQLSIFAFDGGEGISEESYPNDMFYYILSGTPTMTIDNRIHMLAAGDVMVMDSDVLHALAGQKPYQLLQIMLNNEKGDFEMKKMIQHLNPSAVLSLKDEVCYEKNQVVSLTLVNQTQIGMTLFAFDEGTKISAHSSPGDAMPLILDGEAEITIGDQVYHVKAGESIVMPANVPHALKAVTPFKMLLIVVREAL